ncbi:bZIP transcription factor 17 [Cynara cardunculus var. scolymus]|uniref:Basic-leucine zipper domain-containing protein n=1 Tax=Cynara cardunculus var. scolymus TaxID=59895 RepID=A0A124SFJ2_CYNCS|nr:bZIP transcription factor 17 [Cynara cardunculus var. scolymus]KVI03438.1 Basic-leucine zipper domain-containing protein [Cynara cardunculus var. scolymus]
MADAQAMPDSLPIPPIFSDDLTLPDDFLSFDDEDFDITFDDIHLPSDTEDFFNSAFKSSNPIDLSSSDPEFNDFVSDPETIVADSGHHGSDVSGFLNILSPDDSGKGFVHESVRVLDDSSPESRHENPVSSQGSGNCGSAGSDAAMNCPSPDSGNSVVDQKVKRESGSNFVLKRKKESSDGSPESRTMKFRRSNETSTTTENSDQVNEKDEKKKARLIRNRESAQLSRQRKKHYVEELEDKVRAMHSTIQDLNARITYFAAENATLKQQMVAGGGPVCSPPVMYPPHPAMAPMGYPWMPCPPYVVKSQGSQVPLVPIPRLKPQQPPSSQKVKKVEVKKTEGTTKTKSKTKTKTKKVASISFLGFLLFIVLFGGLVPTMNVKFGGATNGGYSGGSNDYRFYEQQHPGRVLMGGDHVNGTNHRTGVGSGRANEHNASEPLVASLYVPRNDKLVKIDGNLIIHSVLASEKAMASQEEQGMTKKEDTGLAVALDLVPAISIPAVGRNGGRQPHMYRTSSDRQRALSSDNENLKSKPADGKLQQWFREGLAGPMLSSGMCTEVFQFDVSVASASGAIVPATSVGNITAEDHRENSTYITTTTVKNRRILHGLPIPISNITKEHVAGHESKHEEHHKNNSVSSMVVSVLVDPREAGDGGGDVEGMMGGKSFSRIFVVVLLDSVKYVTYSCMLPLKGAGHLVTA